MLMIIFSVIMLILQCEDNLLQYGKRLLQKQPRATTELLIDLCSGNLGKKTYDSPEESVEPTKNASGSSAPAVLSYLGYNRVTTLFGGDQTSSSTTAIAPAFPQEDGVSRFSKVSLDGGLPKSEADVPSYIPPTPRQYFAHFVDHHDLFIQFLEAVAFTLWNQEVQPGSSSTIHFTPREPETFSDPNMVDQRAVWNTLLELYLASIKSAEMTTSNASDIAREKALGLLSQSSTIPYDPMHALILCSSTGFTDGLVGLWESMGMYEDILRFYMELDKPVRPGSHAETVNGVGGGSFPGESSPSEQVLRYLDLYGTTNPHLYPLVLRYLTSSPLILSRHPTQLAKLLQTIDDERIMPPLAVVQLLSRNGVASVGSVKDWLRAKVAETNQDIDSVSPCIMKDCCSVYSPIIWSFWSGPDYYAGQTSR
jgi:hypothetical protein